MLPPRPDLSQVDPIVRMYIEALEAIIINPSDKPPTDLDTTTSDVAYDQEAPNTVQLITISRLGIAKRTPRYLYSQQRRGGMGIFDLETTDNDFLSVVTIAELDGVLILITNHARAFRFPVSSLQEGPIRSRGKLLSVSASLSPDEYIAAALPFYPKGAIVLVSENGMVRHLRYHIFGEHMKPGTSMFPSSQFGLLASACVTNGDADILIATRQGRGIRFSEKLIPSQGCLGMRIEPNDQIVAVTSISQDEGVILVDAQGRGSIRLMSGFSANKSPGGSGKILMNTDCLVNAATTQGATHTFLISKLSKIIRFALNEIPQKENPVQGVALMSLRADEVSSLALS